MTIVFAIKEVPAQLFTSNSFETTILHATPSTTIPTTLYTSDKQWSPHVLAFELHLMDKFPNGFAKYATKLMTESTDQGDSVQSNALELSGEKHEGILVGPLLLLILRARWALAHYWIDPMQRKLVKIKYGAFISHSNASFRNTSPLEHQL